MNHIINDLITYLESSPHKVATKAYVLNRLRESQRHECEFCEQLPVYEMSVLRNGLQLVKEVVK